jgi:hypothetical protein
MWIEMNNKVSKQGFKCRVFAMGDHVKLRFTLVLPVDHPTASPPPPHTHPHTPVRSL